MKDLKGVLIVFILMFAVQLSYADKVEIPINKTFPTGEGLLIGHISAEDTPYGLLLVPSIQDLDAGPHGFHIHQNPDCRAIGKHGKMVPGLGAGGHYDPANTGEHLGPYKEGHLGDLPILWVDSEGNANTPVLAPRVKVSDLKGRSLMIHSGGDNFSDIPKKLGGGGARVACGVVP